MCIHIYLFNSARAPVFNYILNAPARNGAPDGGVCSGHWSEAQPALWARALAPDTVPDAAPEARRGRRSGTLVRGTARARAARALAPDTVPDAAPEARRGRRAGALVRGNALAAARAPPPDTAPGKAPDPSKGARAKRKIARQWLGHQSLAGRSLNVRMINSAHARAFEIIIITY